MRRVLGLATGTAALLLAVALAGCGLSLDSTVNVFVIGRANAPFEAGPRLSGAAQLVRAATVEGLVGLDEQGRVIPGLADRWIVTDDGQSYIFRLRDGTWPDGAPISAQSARQALRQAIASLRGTPLALDLARVDDIRVMADRVVEIRLERPMPDLLQLLAQAELGLARKGRGAGPMRLRREGDLAILVPISPEERGMPVAEDWSERIRPIHLSALPASQAIERFNRGEADFVLGGRIEQFPLTGSSIFSRGSIQLDPVTGLFGLSVVNAAGFLAEPENREAIAMAIDREGLMAAFGISGWTATNRIVAPGMPGDSGTIGERWAGQGLDQRRREASARVARWRNGQADPVRLRIALPQGPGSDLLFARLSGDLGQIGIEAVRRNEGQPADLRLVDVVARHRHASWFLNQLACGAQPGLCSASADKLAAEARDAADTASRSSLLADAEAELTLANVFIPFGAPVRWSMVRGNASGFSANRWGFHPLMPMASLPR